MFLMNIFQQINVGQCVGACPGNETETCLLRDKREPSRCLAGLYSKQHTCTPARFKVHEYRYDHLYLFKKKTYYLRKVFLEKQCNIKCSFRTRRGSKREVIQIIQCICVQKGSSLNIQILLSKKKDETKMRQKISFYVAFCE